MPDFATFFYYIASFLCSSYIKRFLTKYQYKLTYASFERFMFFYRLCSGILFVFKSVLVLLVEIILGGIYCYFYILKSMNYCL